MGGFFSQLHDAFTGGAPDGPNARLRNSFVSTKESQAAQEKQAETENMQRQQQHDLDFHDKMMGLGAKYVHDSGLVQEAAPAADQDEMAAPAQSQTFVRQSIPERIIKHKTAEGQTVQYELPTPEEQIANQGKRALLTQQANLPAAKAESAQAATAKEAENTAGARGTGAGKSQAEQADLAARGIDIGPDEAAATGLPAGTKRILPEQAVNLAGKVQPATIRANASTSNASTRAQSVQAVADLKKQQEEEMLAHRDQWERARNALGVQRNGIAASRATGANAVRGRQLVGDQQLHEKNLSQAYKEDQNALAAQGLLGEEEGSNWIGQKTTTPSVPDGEEFNDPFTGKKMTMSKFQRQRLQSSINLAQQRSNDLKASAEQIAKRYGIGQQQSQPAGAAPAAQAQPAAAQPQQQQQHAQPIPPKVGEIRKGYKFKGGNYADQSSWEKVPGQ